MVRAGIMALMALLVTPSTFAMSLAFTPDTTNCNIINRFR